jgi:hypothetical protein
MSIDSSAKVGFSDAESEEGAAGRGFTEYFDKYGGGGVQAKMELNVANQDPFGIHGVDPSEPDRGAALAAFPVQFNITTAAPNLTTAAVAGQLQQLVHAVPSARHQVDWQLNPGDAMPEFGLRRSDGEVVTLADLRGKPFAIRLTRAVGSGII